MRNVGWLNITLPLDMVRLMRGKVQSGGYASNSELIREAMRAWQEKDQEGVGSLATVRARIAQADAETAAPLSDADVDRHFAQRRAQSRAARAESKDHA